MAPARLRAFLEVIRTWTPEAATFREWIGLQCGLSMSTAANGNENFLELYDR